MARDCDRIRREIRVKERGKYLDLPCPPAEIHKTKRQLAKELAIEAALYAKEHRESMEARRQSRHQRKTETPPSHSGARMSATKGPCDLRPGPHSSERPVNRASDESVAGFPHPTPSGGPRQQGPKALRDEAGNDHAQNALQKNDRPAGEEVPASHTGNRSTVPGIPTGFNPVFSVVTS